MADSLSIESLEEKRLSTPNIKGASHLFWVATIVGVTAGLYASMVGHQYAYGVSREVAWGLVISSFAFFALIASGLCIISAISNAYGVTVLAPLSTRAVYMSIVTVCTAFMLLGLGVESPWRLIIYNATSPSLTSNIWWMCTLFGIMSGCMFFRFFSLIAGRFIWAINLGIIGAVAAVGANNNVGGLFTMAADPPIWHGYQLLIFFLASSVMSGTAAIILFTEIAYRLRKQKIEKETEKALHSAGTILALMLGILIVSSISRYYSMFFSDQPDPGQVAAIALIRGPLSLNFWLFEVAIGLLAPLVILIVTQTKNTKAMMTAAVMALVGAFFQRFDLVMAGQIIPKFPGWSDAPAYQLYFPSAVEFLVVLGAFGLTGAGFLMGERFIGRIFSLHT